LKKFKSLILYMLCSGLWCSSKVSTGSDYIWRYTINNTATKIMIEFINSYQ
jgi:hypothetical protein